MLRTKTVVEPITMQTFEFEGRMLVPLEPVTFYPHTEVIEEFGREMLTVNHRLFNRFVIVATAPTVEELKEEISDFMFFYWDTYSSVNEDIAPEGSKILSAEFNKHFLGEVTPHESGSGTQSIIHP